MAQFITAAGIDVSKSWLDVALWPDDAAVLHIERSEAGCFDRLAAWLREQGVSRVGLEASGGYETEVMDALQARGFEVVRYNAYHVCQSQWTVGQERSCRCRGPGPRGRRAARQACHGAPG